MTLINPFRKLDDFLIDLCTRFSHRLQRDTGVTNYAIAKCGVGLASISLLLGIGNYFHQFLRDRTTVVSLIIAILCLLFFAQRAWHCDQMAEDLSDNPTVKDETFESSIFYRMMWIGFLITDIAKIVLQHTIWRHPPFIPVVLEIAANPLFSVGLMIFYYFALVQPLPRSKSRLKQWVESLGQQPELVPVTERR